MPPRARSAPRRPRGVDLRLRVENLLLLRHPSTRSGARFRHCGVVVAAAGLVALRSPSHLSTHRFPTRVPFSALLQREIRGGQGSLLLDHVRLQGARVERRERLADVDARRRP